MKRILAVALLVLAAMAFVAGCNVSLKTETPAPTLLSTWKGNSYTSSSKTTVVSVINYLKLYDDGTVAISNTTLNDGYTATLTGTYFFNGSAFNLSASYTDPNGNYLTSNEVGTLVTSTKITGTFNIYQGGSLETSGYFEVTKQ